MAKVRNMGFKSGHFGRVTQNESSGYACDSEVFALPALQSSTGDGNISDINIDADDTTYYKGKRFENGTITVTVAELSTESYAELTGEEYDETEDGSPLATLENSPEIWLSFASAQLEAGFTILQLYSCRCSNINILEATTKGADNTTGQSVEITFEYTKRKFDEKPGRRWGSQPDVSKSATPPDTVPAP